MFCLKIPPFFWNRSRGYSLIEFSIVLAVIATLAATIVFGMRSFNNMQVVTNAQKQFVANLRAAQGRAENGAIATNGKIIQEVFVPASGGTSYQINGVTINLPPGVRVSTNQGAITFCLNNRNLSQFDDNVYDGIYAHRCANNCTIGTGFWCGSAGPSSAPVRVTFSNGGTVNKAVDVFGSGMQINEVNALP